MAAPKNFAEVVYNIRGLQNQMRFAVSAADLKKQVDDNPAFYRYRIT